MRDEMRDDMKYEMRLLRIELNTTTVQIIFAGSLKFTNAI